MGKRSLELAKQIGAIDSEILRKYRVTKLMAKHEYLAMLYSRSAAVANICQDKLPDSNTRAIYFAHKALEEYDMVLALYRESFAPSAQDSNHPRLLEVAMKIVDFTTWYAARAACILYLRGQYDYNDAYRLAQQAYDFAPKELDIWINEVGKKRRDENPKVTDRKEIT